MSASFYDIADLNGIYPSSVNKIKNKTKQKKKEHKILDFDLKQNFHTDLQSILIHCEYFYFSQLPSFFSFSGRQGLPQSTVI